TNFPGTQRYNGFELSVSKRMSNRSQLMTSYVWSRLDGDLLATTGTLAGDPNNPNQVIPTQATGSGTNDQPHAFKVLGSYQARYGITLGANYQAISGLPFDRTFRAAGCSATVTTNCLNQGATTVRADVRGTDRADFLNLMSLRADKSFRLGGTRSRARLRCGVARAAHTEARSDGRSRRRAPLSLRSWAASPSARGSRDDGRRSRPFGRSAFMRPSS